MVQIELTIRRDSVIQNNDKIALHSFLRKMYLKINRVHMQIKLINFIP